METELSSQMLTKQLTPEVAEQLALVREHLVKLGRDELQNLVETANGNVDADS